MTIIIKNDAILIDANIVLREVFDYFAADPIGPLLNLHRVAADSENPISHLIMKQLTLFDHTIIEAVKEDKQFQFFSGKEEGADLDREAGLWMLNRLLLKGIPEARMKILIDSLEKERPVPYDHPAVASLKLDSECMVPLNSFQVKAGALIRAETGFTIMPPIQSPNSQYWLLQALLRERLHTITTVRLDPFIVQPAKDYACMEYRMWWYGRPLDWDRIDTLKSEEHGRWAPGKLSTQAAYTDFAWTPRDGEVHFRCEEIPLKDDLLSRGSRYFHAIYSPVQKKIIHLDGAIRVYKPEEWEIRKANHVRNSGKIGKRIKIFRVGTDVPRDCIGTVCSSFFVWNYDVARYFGANISNDI